MKKVNALLQYGLETDVAKHLSDNYGDRAWTVCSLEEPTGERWPVHGRRLAPPYPCKSEFHTLASILMLFSYRI